MQAADIRRLRRAASWGESLSVSSVAVNRVPAIPPVRQNSTFTLHLMKKGFRV
jgi:hypothetical protein